MGKCFSQDSLRNTVMIELLGNGILYSINYEYQLRNQIVVRLGTGLDSKDWIIPLTVGKYFGQGKDHFEFLLGCTLLHYHFYSSRGNVFFATAFIGYRLQKPNSPISFRAGFTPLFRVHEEHKIEPGITTIPGRRFFPLAGVSLGYRF